LRIAKTCSTAVNARPERQKKRLKLVRAIMQMTRIDEWCLEAETAKEARQVFASGLGNRCHLGDCIHAEVDRSLDE
jgi:hypothetical protein